MIRIRSAALVALTVLLPLCAHSSPLPKGWVKDGAALLSEPTRQMLEQEIQALERETGAEMAVVTVTSLEGQTVEQVAHRLFNDWGIGKKDKNNGILLLVAPREHRMRIEVGYGLEPLLPDGLAGEIIRTEMTPAFKAGEFDRGVLRGTERVMAVIRANQPLPSSYQPPLSTSDIWGLTVMAGLLLMMAGAALGSGVSSKMLLPLFFGVVFLAVGALISLPLLSRATLVVLAAVTALFGALGYRSGRGHSRYAFDRKKRRYVRAWSWIWAGRSGSGGGSSSSSDSSSSSGDDFGGGSSGGGGASGSW